jgi:hypothetical protein
MDALASHHPAVIAYRTSFHERKSFESEGLSTIRVPVAAAHK